MKTTQKKDGSAWAQDNKEMLRCFANKERTNIQSNLRGAAQSIHELAAKNPLENAPLHMDLVEDCFFRQKFEEGAEDLDARLATFEPIWEVFSPEVTGNAKWGKKVRCSGVISTHTVDLEVGRSAKVQKLACITASDEAFTLTLLQNCHLKWTCVSGEKAAGREINWKTTENDME